ncbi:phosphomannose isomerase type II C-terminal cupin domain [Ciceribacter sp. RN22]|uniref:phosphomannose isomerase type II C-terminal cupin domain n=1 Tax=Ciceribacter sp. RN22 TaxID=2954932 RepID=UPI00209205CF|nr:phosphomannose isomerase type II C-terminal cupin domain [Ciceribacter sp. RN22]MCO6177015.1 phosphomannose isomerase type II C-terminal cupin domain [Ciceribacter sp. RN22]
MTIHSIIPANASAVPADAPLHEERPWGAFWSLDRGTAHQVKRIRVNPKGRLSLQYHHHRAERWVVIEGTATITVDDTVLKVKPGGVVVIPKGAVHRLENLTKTPVEIIEVQLGDYLGEDDIVRLDDIYNRPEREVRA